MSYLINAVDEWLSRTTNIPDGKSSTICGWAKRSVYVFSNSIIQVAGTDNAFMQIYWTADGTLSFRDASVETNFASEPGNGAWFFWAITQGAVNRTLYWAAENASSMNASFTQAVLASDGTPSAMYLAASQWEHPLQGYIAAVKAWSVVLSEAELLAEKPYRANVKTANILFVTPLKTDAADDSGNGYDWTVTNATNEVDEPSASYLTDAPAAGGAPGSIYTTITL